MKQRPLSRIRQKTSRGVAQIDTATDLDRSKVNWDDLRIFAHVAEARSLRRAAARLGVQTSTVSRRIKLLEDALCTTLLIRSPDGVHLTELGDAIYKRARDLSMAVANMERDAQGSGPRMSGRVRLSITEGIGTYWLIPRLIEFQRVHSKLIIDTKCTMEILNALSVETDLSVQYDPPKAADLKAMRLGCLHIIPFVSRAYYERFGRPQSAKELARHKIITQTSTQVDENIFLQQFGIKHPEGVIGFRINSSAAHYALIKKGAGIGVLPTYAACLDRSLIPLEIEGVYKRLEIWLTFHPEVRRIPRIAAVIDFVQSCFDKTRFPWFRDDYVPPAELAKLESSDWVMNMVDFG